VQQCIGAGVLTGPASQGLLVLDFDEPEEPEFDGLSEETFQQVFGRPSSELPVTATNSSGRRGRRKVFLMVPEDWWPELGNWSFDAGPYAEGKKHAFEALWLNGTGTAKQAVIAGDHPMSNESQTLCYHWVDGLHPAMVGVATAPAWVLGSFIRQVQRNLAPKAAAEEDSFEIKRAAGEPQPCDLLLPKDQRRLLLLMQKHWPYRGAPADSPFAASYQTAFRPLVAGLLNVLGKDTALAWLGGQEWDRKNDWDDGNLGSFEGLMDSLSRSATDADSKCGWGSIVTAALAGGFVWPKWALPPKQIDVDDFTTSAAKKVSKLREALEVIDAMDSPVDRLASYQELTRIVGCKESEMSQLVQLMQQESDKGLQEGSLEEVLNNAADIEPAIENLLALGAVTMVAADGGVGKSVLIYRIAEAVANGAKFGGTLQAVQGNVLVVQKDESAANAKQKLRLMGMQVPPNSVIFKFNFNAAMYPELRKWIREHQARVVVMDSFGSLFGGAVGMGEAEVGLHLYRLNQIASEEGVAILLTHHLRKMDKSKAGARKEVHLGDLFGSSYIVNGASDVWAVVRDSESKEPKFVLTVLKPRTGITMAGDRFELIGSNEDLSLTITSHNGEADGTEKLRGLKAKVVECLKGRSEEAALDLNEISAAVNAHRGSVERVVKSLVSAEYPGLQRLGQKRPGTKRPTYTYWVSE
jgi:predicted transcriptional regulator